MLNYKSKTELTKRFLIITIVLSIVFACLLFVTSVNTYAEDDRGASGRWNSSNYNCPLCANTTHNLTKLDGAQEMIYHFNNIINSADFINGTLESALKFDVTQDPYKDLWEKGRSYYETLSKIGQMLCIIYVLISLLEEGGKDSLTPEKIIGALIKIFVAQLIIVIGYDILEAVVNFATSIYNSMPTAQNDTDLSGLCNYSAAKGYGIGDILGSLMGMIIPYIAMLAAIIILNVVCWARILDIMVRVIFAPIGMANMVQEGTRGSGFKYLKKIAASAVSGAVMFGVFQSYNALRTVCSNLGLLSASLTDQGAVITTLILAFTLISTLFKAKTVADDIFGV